MTLAVGGTLNPNQSINQSISFIHIIDCGYSVESFNDAHEKEMSFYSLYNKTTDAKFS